jgi:ATP-binding cassette subfamily B protein
VARRACGSRPAVVQEDQLGAADDRHGEREALLLAARQPPVRRPAAALQTEPFDERVHVQGMGVQFRDMAEHLLRAGTRVDAAGLEHHADTGVQLPGLSRRIEAQDAHRAGVRPAVSLAGLDRGRLARAVGSEYGGDARRGHQVEAVHRGLRAVPLHQGLDLDHGLASHEEQV